MEGLVAGTRGKYGSGNISNHQSHANLQQFMPLSQIQNVLKPISDRSETSDVMHQMDAAI